MDSVIIKRSPSSKIKKPRVSVLSQLTPHENIYTVPNILTFSRLIAAPIIGYLVLHDYHAWALGLFAYAGITDLVDGYIARRWNLQTVVGTVIDPMADKTLMTILTVCLAINGSLPGIFILFQPASIAEAHRRDSVVGRNYSRTRHRSWISRHILPVDFSASSQNIL